MTNQPMRSGIRSSCFFADVQFQWLHKIISTILFMNYHSALHPSPLSDTYPALPSLHTAFILMGIQQCSGNHLLTPTLTGLYPGTYGQRHINIYTYKKAIISSKNSRTAVYCIILQIKGSLMVINATFPPRAASYTYSFLPRLNWATQFFSLTPHCRHWSMKFSSFVNKLTTRPHMRKRVATSRLLQ